MPDEVIVEPGRESEPELDSFQDLFQQIVEATAAVDQLKKPELTARHLKETTYPLMGKLLATVIDLRDRIRGVEDDLDRASLPLLEGEDLEYLVGFNELVFAFLTKHAGDVPQGSAVHQEMVALFQGAQGAKAILLAISDGVHSEEVE